MAEVPAANGNGLFVDVRNKTLGILGPNVPLILIIILLALAIWRADKIQKRLDAVETLFYSQMDEVRKQHAILIYNQRHAPEDHLTLDLPVPKEHK